MTLLSCDAALTLHRPAAVPRGEDPNCQDRSESVSWQSSRVRCRCLALHLPSPLTLCSGTFAERSEAGVIDMDKMAADVNAMAEVRTGE